NSALPVLPDTGIREIDHFSHAIEHLEQEVMDSSLRFMQIISMASVDLAGYEIWEDSDNVFVTANYFPLLGVEDVDLYHLTAEGFLAKQEEITQGLKSTPAEDGSIVYAIPLSDGETRYIRAESTKSGKRLVGVIEDVTTSTLEKLQIERERDCDGLTKLYGRRGFRREADEMFLRPELLKQAALLMIDLDNLKTTNDRFGHNFGDLYIQTAGKCFLENTPDNTICARISGDEFLVLFYGYESQEEIRRDLQSLYRAIGEVKFVLPNGDNMGLSASGGVAWYPQDSEELSELMKYADFAMYQVKRSVKGQLKEFNLEAYQEKMRQNQSRLEFHQMLENRQVSYHFQPIFDARTGEVYAYEALMRVDFPTLRSPETVLQIAKEENCMHDIEYMTMFCACEDYQKLLKRSQVADHAFLFINSIASERMTLEEEQEFHERFAQIQPKIVVEITETEHMDMVCQKREAVGFSGDFALDDYGSGYNSEVSLLELKPKYVKVDIAIARDVDKDRDKQYIVENIVTYAHERAMKVIVEGLETEAELRKSLELGVDLLQGFFLARPGAVPPAISDEAKRIIRSEQL
ncbi:MAG: GGDEF and EAL domain-containing protein, partial [Butyrivibrio sp.]|nr:GGDEF and EAL domain-containing protein [Butyrivibrio sp.]